jgi:TrmH family RNA methyltransferase
MTPTPASVHIVLVGTTHPGNIGASARAMRTMGFTNLRLVRPAGFPGADVTAMAAGASDVLAAAGVFDSLELAIADCGLVFGTSARLRGLPWPEQTPEQAAARIAGMAAADGGVAIVFGRESSGLSNEELALCNAMILIPASDDFQSLNLAAAVQIICYELRKAFSACGAEAFRPAGGRRPGRASGKSSARPATAAEMEQFYAHLEQCLAAIGFYDPERPRRLLTRLRRLFNRAQLDENEYNILRGILAAVQEKTGRKQAG